MGTVSNNLIPIAIDVETTGLDPKTGVILEVALASLDPSNIEKTTGMYHSVIKTSINDLKKMNDFVKKMHIENRLLLDLGFMRDSQDNVIPIADSYKVLELETCAEVEAQIIAFIEKRLDPSIEDQKVILMGNSLGGLDIPFLKEHMPNLMGKPYMHYRVIDVTSINQALAISHPTRHVDFDSDAFLLKKNRELHYQAISNMDPKHQLEARKEADSPDFIVPNRAVKHRAATDVMICVEQFRFLMKKVY